MPNGTYRIHLPDNIKGRSILNKVIPTVCSLERMLDKLIINNCDYTKLKPWEKSCYRAYQLYNVLTELLSSSETERVEIIKENLLSVKPQELGPNCIDIYIVAYVAEKHGKGKDIFCRFIKDQGISDKDNSAQAIWQVGKGDGVYLGVLNHDGSVKDWEFFEKWLGGDSNIRKQVIPNNNDNPGELNNIVKSQTLRHSSTTDKKAEPVRRDYYKDDYLNEKEVIDFSKWLDDKLDPAGGFNHSYYLAKAKRDWRCSSLYEAYENYWWPYSINCNLLGQHVRGHNYSQSYQYMEILALKLRNAVKNGNYELAEKISLSMLAWGGVLNRNRERIEEMGTMLCNYYAYVQKSLNLKNVHLNLQNDIHINSGFTKLYFLLVDDFIMYDGRVGAALGLLGRLYAEEKGLPNIPWSIEFSFGSGKTATYNKKFNRRNPSTEKYKLPEFTGNRTRHLNDNIKASWLLKSIADKTTSRFSKLPQDPPLNMRLTAIQSALFMIGYDVTR